MADEALHCLHPWSVLEGKPNVVAAFRGEFDLARLLVPADQAKLLRDGGWLVSLVSCGPRLDAALGE